MVTKQDLDSLKEEKKRLFGFFESDDLIKMQNDMILDEKLKSDKILENKLDKNNKLNKVVKIQSSANESLLNNELNDDDS